MAGINNGTLYPPIIDTTMPSFPRDSNSRIYFSLSNFNTIKDIKNVQVTVRHLGNNLTALDPALYPTGIKIVTEIKEDLEIKGDNKYYIEINPSDLTDKVFGLNQYYRVQLRFTSASAADIQDLRKLAAWLSANLSFFSEWSSVCLIHGIGKPTLRIEDLEMAELTDSSVYTEDTLDLHGTLSFNQKDVNEAAKMEYYVVNVYSNEGKLLYTSGTQYPIARNQVSHSLSYVLTDGESYIIEIKYMMTGGYEDSSSYNITVIKRGMETIQVTVQVTPDNDRNRIEVRLLNKDPLSSEYLGNITIRRTSNLSDYAVWEDVFTTLVDQYVPIDYSWYDYTAESGVYYRYGVQSRKTDGTRGTLVKSKDPVAINLEEIFLVGDGKQLNLKFNPTISSFKINTLESRVDTLGSKYPFIKRNGNAYYRSFPISGLITSFMDEYGDFTNEAECYGNILKQHRQYNEDRDVNSMYDHDYEKRFRDKVLEFLHDGKAKLFKSTEEGNIIVRLMDINLTPDTSLGRLLYSFSCTAYEVDEASIDNYSKYKIQSKGSDTLQSLVSTTFRFGQLYGTFNDVSPNLLDVISDHFAQNNDEVGFINRVDHLTWLRIEFDSEPYLIERYGGTYIPLLDGTKVNQDTILGYIVYINNMPIVVSARGFYETKDTEVKALSFPKTTTALLDYSAEVIKEEDTKKAIKNYRYSRSVGQVWGNFEYKEPQYKHLYLKHFQDFDEFFQRLLTINCISFEGPAGTRVWVQHEDSDGPAEVHVIGPNGTLRIDYSEDDTIKEFYFDGIQMHESKDGNRIDQAENRFYEIGEIYNSLDEITNPKKNYVYRITKNVAEEEEGESAHSYVRKIYYEQEWHDFTDDNVVACDVNAIVDYTFEMVKGEYKNE